MPELPHEPLEETLRRLKAERDEADRRYNEALTALDRPLAPGLKFPQPPPAYDETQITPLNEAWNILPEPPAGSGWSARLTGLVWRTVAPYFQRQLTFNSRLVDHVNRNVAAHRESARAAEATAVLLHEQMAALDEFHSRLLQFLQQITGYVDTKDRDSAAGALVLNASLSAMADNLAKRWESMTAREQRYETRTAAIAAEHAEIRALVGISQQAALTLKREVEKLLTPQVRLKPDTTTEVRLKPDATTEVRLKPDATTEVRLKPDATTEVRLKPDATTEVRLKPDAARVPREAFTTPLDAYKYVGFEDQFRGSREAIRERLQTYVPFFPAEGVVLDVGCGRGEFLDLLGEHRIPGRGIDLNHEMAEACRARGLDVAEADAVGYLESLDDGSLGGIFAAQVVEHLQPSYLLRFLELAHHKVRPGGRLVLETLNPACWVAFFESYIRDITHVWPLHPETLKYLVLASGFTRADVEFRSPVPAQDRLQPIVAPEGADTALADLVETFNANVEKLNARMFTHLDYAIVAER